jgi:hypothetical protein
MSNSKRWTDDGEAADKMVPVDGFFTDGNTARGKNADAVSEEAKAGTQKGPQDSAVDLAQAYWGGPDALPLDMQPGAPPPSSSSVWSMTPDSQSGGRSGAANDIWGTPRTERPLTAADAAALHQQSDPFSLEDSAQTAPDALLADNEAARSKPQETARTETAPQFDPFMGSPFGAPMGVSEGDDFFPGAPDAEFSESKGAPTSSNAGETRRDVGDELREALQAGAPLWAASPFDEAAGQPSRRENQASEPGANEASDGEPSLHPVSHDESGAEILPWPGRAAAPSVEAPTRIMSSGPDDAFPSDAPQQRAPGAGLDAVAPDLLAEAVESALRSVYGEDVDDDAASEQDPYVAERGLLRETSPGAPDSAPAMRDIYGVDPDGSGRGDQEAANEGAEDWFGGRLEHQPAAFVAEPTTEAATEAVLHYLYGRRDAGGEATDIFGPKPQYALEGDPYRDRSPVADSRGAASPFAPRRTDDPTSFDDPFARRPAGGRTEPSFRSPTAEEDLRWDPLVPARSLTRIQQPEPESTPRGHDAEGTGHDLGDKDSGRLLGVAGLSLLGGIAVGGVVAAIAFNFFVTDPGVEYTGEQPAMNALGRSGGGVTFNPPPKQAAREPSGLGSTRRTETAALPASPYGGPASLSAPASPAKQREKAENPISVSNATGAAPGPIPISLSIAPSAPAQAALVSIKGLPDRAKLSGGIDVGGGRWLLPPQKVGGLALSVPRGVSGDFNLEAQLMASDVRTAVSEAVPFTVTIIGAEQTGSPTGSAPQPPQVTGERPDRRGETQENRDLLQDGNKLMREGDILAARKYYQKVAASGSPEGALAMGRSYDPSYYENLPVRTGKPDPAQAFEWYKKALNGGLDTARVKIDNLKQWLLR